MTTTGDTEYLNSSGQPARLAAPADGTYSVSWATGVPSWVAAGGSAHALLSATHSDTLAAAVVRGSLIVGNATPKWAALAIGTVGKVLQSDGTDAAWATPTGTGVPVLATSPTLVTPVLGVAAGTSLALTEAVGASALTLTGATQTASFPVLNASQTWNSAGVTFLGLKFNVTNTASAAGSRLLDLQVAAASMYSVDVNGFIHIAPGGAGTAVRPIVVGAGSIGFDFLVFNNRFTFETTNSEPLWSADLGSFYVNSSIGMAVDGNALAPDLFLRRDAAQVLGHRNGTTAQKVRVYNTFTTVDTSGEWFDIDWITEANVCVLTTRKGSSAGTLRGLKLGAAATVPLGLYGTTPVVQATTAGGASTFAANTSAIANDTATFDGYTLGQVVKALRNLGALA